MVSFFTQKIVCRLTKNRNVSEEDLEVYNYVLEFLIENILFFALIITIGILSGKIKEMCVFFIVFLLLRKTAGGIHANTPESCMFFSIMIYLINIYGAKAIDKIIQPLNIGIEIIAAIASVIVCYITVLILQLMGIVKNKKEGVHEYEDKRE